MAKRTPKRVKEALETLAALGLPSAQQNERSALCLLALLDLGKKKQWAEADSPLMGITPIMDWVRTNYKRDYAPNTRETFRRQTMHQFVQAGIARYNPDKPSRPVNSPKAVYQIAQPALTLLRSFGTPDWHENLADYLATHGTLAQRFAKERDQQQVPLNVEGEGAVILSPGAHSELIKAIVEDFGPRFAPGGALVYVGDTGEKWGYLNESILLELGIELDSHGKMPDVIVYHRAKNWLLLIEAVTSHGPVDPKRHAELSGLFGVTAAGLVYVTAFPDRSTLSRYLGDISWETEVWVADTPSHLIHFNGDRFLGPH